MQKQVYNITREDECVKIWKNDKEVYCVLIESKSINLKQLYDNMLIDINDEYFFAHGLNKVDEPKSDVERIFNNTYDFLSRLLVELGKKTKELRAKESNSTF